MAVLTEPSPALLVVGQNLFNEGPKSRRVVLLSNVTKLVNQDVIDDFQRSHHDAPGDG